MNLFRILALVSIVVFLVVVAVPTHFLAPAVFWFGLSFAFFLCEGAFGGVVIGRNSAA